MSYQWMPLYVGDYLSDTRHLDYRGHGAYLLLLMSCWRTGSLPDDDVMLARLASCPLEIWKRDLRRQVMPFFTMADDGRWHQKRMDVEIAHRDSVSEKRAAAAEAARASKAERAKAARASTPKSPPTNTEASPETKPPNTLTTLTSPLANETNVALSRGGEPEPEPEKKEVREATPLSSSGDDGPPALDQLDLLPSASITRLKTTDDAAAAIAAWNTLASKAGLPQVAKLSDPRRRSLLARLRECGGIDGWNDALHRVAASDFLCGGGSRGWRCDFDFVITQSKFTKLMEGGFDNRQTTATTSEPKSRMEDLHASWGWSTAQPPARDRDDDYPIINAEAYSA